MKKLYRILILFLIMMPITVFAAAKPLSTESDVVLLIDSVTAGGDAWAEIGSKLNDIIDQITPNGESLKVGAIIYRGHAYNYDLVSVNKSNIDTVLADIKSTAADIETDVLLPSNKYTKLGYNIHAALLAADSMLAEDVNVPNRQKYILTVTSGITYTWYENDEQVGIYITESSGAGNQRVYAPAEISYEITKYPQGARWSPSEGWLSYLTTNKEALDELAATKALPYDQATTWSETYVNGESQFDTIDVALLKTYEAFNQMKTKYNAYMFLTTPNGKYGESFVSFLSDGKTTAATLSDFNTDLLAAYQEIENNKKNINDFITAILNDNKLDINSYKLIEDGLIYVNNGKSYISSIYNGILQKQYKDKIEEFFENKFYLEFELNTTNQDNMYLHFFQIVSDGTVDYQNKEVELNFHEELEDDSAITAIVNDLLTKTQRIDETDPENPVISYEILFEDMDSIIANKDYLSKDRYYQDGDLNSSDLYKEIFTDEKVSYINYPIIAADSFEVGEYSRSLDTVFVITYEGIPYMITDLSKLTTKNVIYIPNSTNEASEDYITAALKRINTYFEEDTISIDEITLKDSTTSYKMTINGDEFFYTIEKKDIDEDEVEKLIAERKINKFINDNFVDNKLPIDTISLDNYFTSDEKLNDMYTLLLNRQYRSILDTYETSDITLEYIINYTKESTKEITFNAYKNTTNKVYTKTINLSFAYADDIGDNVSDTSTLVNSIKNETRDAYTDEESGEVTINHKVVIENLEYVGYLFDNSNPMDILSHSEFITNKFKYNDYTYEFIKDEYAKDDISETYKGYLLIYYNNKICGFIDNFVIQIDNIIYIPKTVDDNQSDYITAATTVIKDKYTDANIIITYGGLTSSINATTDEVDYYKLSTTGKIAKILIKKESLTEEEKTELRYLGIIDNLIDEITTSSGKVKLNTIELDSMLSDPDTLKSTYETILEDQYKIIFDSYQTDDYTIDYSIEYDSSNNKTIKFELNTDNYPTTITKNIPLSYEYVDPSTINQTEVNEIVNKINTLTLTSTTDPDTGDTDVSFTYTLDDINLIDILIKKDVTSYSSLDFMNEIDEFKSIFGPDYTYEYINSNITDEPTSLKEEGDLLIRYQGKVVSVINELSINKNNILLIPDVTEESTESYVEAANHRLSLYYPDETISVRYEDDKYILNANGIDYEYIIEKNGLDPQEEIKMKSESVIDDVISSIVEDGKVSVDSVNLNVFPYLSSDLKGDIYSKLFMEKYETSIKECETDEVEISTILIVKTPTTATLRIIANEKSIDNPPTYVIDKDVDVTIEFVSDTNVDVANVDNYMASIASLTETTKVGGDGVPYITHEIVLDDMRLINAFINAENIDANTNYIKFYEDIDSKFDNTNLSYRYISSGGAGGDLSSYSEGALLIIDNDTIASAINFEIATNNTLYIPINIPNSETNYINAARRRLEAYYPNETFTLTRTGTQEDGKDIYNLNINGENYSFFIEKSSLDPDEALKISAERIIKETLDQMLVDDKVPINSIEMTDVNTSELNFIYTEIISEDYHELFNKNKTKYTIDLRVLYDASGTDTLIFTYKDTETSEQYVKNISKELSFVPRSVIDETELSDLMSNIDDITKMTHISDPSSGVEVINRLNITDLDAISLRKKYPDGQSIFKDVSGALKYATDFNALFTNGYTYKSLEAMDVTNSLYTWGGGNFIVYHDGVAVSFNDADYIVTNVLYIPDDTNDAIDDYITAASRRLKRSFSGSSISIRVGGDITDISPDDCSSGGCVNPIFDETPVDWTETLDEYFVITIDGVDYDFVIQKHEGIINLSLGEDLVLNGYETNNTFVSKFGLGESINTFVTKLGDKYTYNFHNNVISTGDSVTDGNETYTVVLYGDLNGDGIINSADLLKMRQHLLGTYPLSGPYEQAAKIVNRTTINSADLLRLRQHLLGTNPINQ